MTPRFWLGARRVEPSFDVVGKETGLVLRVVAISKFGFGMFSPRCLLEGCPVAVGMWL